MDERFTYKAVSGTELVSTNDGGLALSEAMITAKRAHHGLYLGDGTEVMWVPYFYGWSGSNSYGISDGRNGWTYNQAVTSAANNSIWYTSDPTED